MCPLPVVGGEELGGGLGTWGGTSRGWGGRKCWIVWLVAFMCPREPREVPAAINLGQHLTGQTNTTSQKNPTFLPPTPHWYHPRFSNPPNSSPPTKGGEICTLSGSIQMGVPKHPPNFLTLLPMFSLFFFIQQCHLGKLCQFYCLV